MIWVCAALLALLSIYVAFELGRRGAGYDSIDAWRQRSALQGTIKQLQKDNETLRAELAELKTGQVSGRQEREELARSLSDLQGQLARQNQDLAFYRGIVSAAGSANRVSIHRVVISAGEGAGHFKVSVVLAQTARPEKDVAGTVTLSLEGMEQGRPAVYPLTRLSADKSAQLKFSFRYFQDLEQPIALPAGFTPASLTVEVRTAGRGEPAVNQKFEWRVQET